MTEMEWLSGVDPRFDAVVERVRSGRLSASAARAALMPLVGHQRAEIDWRMAVEKAGPCPKGNDPGLWELRAFDQEFPSGDARRRLHGRGPYLYDRVVEALGIKA